VGYYLSKKGVRISKPKKPKYTKAGLLAMSKKEQDDILKSLGVTRPPKRELDRVNKIMELTE